MTTEYTGSSGPRYGPMSGNTSIPRTPSTTPGGAAHVARTTRVTRWPHPQDARAVARHEARSRAGRRETSSRVASTARRAASGSSLLRRLVPASSLETQPSRSPSAIVRAGAAAARCSRASARSTRRQGSRPAASPPGSLGPTPSPGRGSRPGWRSRRPGAPSRGPPLAPSPGATTAPNPCIPPMSCTPSVPRAYPAIGSSTNIADLASRTVTVVVVAGPERDRLAPSSAIPLPSTHAARGTQRSTPSTATRAAGFASRLSAQAGWRRRPQLEAIRTTRSPSATWRSGTVRCSPVRRPVVVR